ncbi:MAG: hypothetical protein LC126_28290 [Bryobacterales bacterium]|nr:hypothetical protein [Bryobacterales bacterium]
MALSVQKSHQIITVLRFFDGKIRLAQSIIAPAGIASTSPHRHYQQEPLRNEAHKIPDAEKKEADRPGKMGKLKSLSIQLEGRRRLFDQRRGLRRAREAPPVPLRSDGMDVE